MASADVVDAPAVAPVGSAAVRSSTPSSPAGGRSIDAQSGLDR